MNLLDIGDDILLHILRISLGREALPDVVLVCRRLYHLGMPFLVAKVYVSSIKSIVRFSKFMDSEASSRWLPHIRSLTTFFSPYSTENQRYFPSWASRVATIIRLSSKLEVFQSDCIEDLLEAEPMIGEALIECRSLTRLHFQGAGTATLDMLALMRSPIREFNITAKHPLKGMNAFSALSPFHSTVTSVSITWLSLLPNEFQVHITFPKVRHLSLLYSTSSTPTLLRIFPYARSIFLASCQMSSGSKVSNTPSWGKLDHLHFSGMDLSEMVLSCPSTGKLVVSCLDGVAGTSGRSDTKPFLRLVEGTYPRHLDVLATHASIIELSECGLGWFIPRTEMFMLHTVDMKSNQNADRVMESVGMIVDSLKSASCLFYLDISLRGTPTGPTLFPNERLQERIQDLANSLPSLLAVWLCDDDGKEFWNVRRDAEDSGKAELRKMPGQTCLDNWSFQYYPASFQDHLRA
ncbi:hypothetical protein JAAARDRAFT_46587 [Jaapia argillacea MUCL 33604]|uniref:F-box domain-containing protein n=1 Tax=Jaapia argillacea MUCL 33604 TaxID=933084 RepID=A0A067PYL6_9AGAM|nr:hypothetical protein JAAARDRAFT_46587 [Jaapia argillacea MUCL 33604]